MVNSNKIGIVVVNYNRGKLVAEITSTFSEYESIDEIVIVDNNSNDNSPYVLSSLKHEKIHCLFLTENLGYAKGNNAGLKFLNKIGCNICFVVNPDVFFTNEIIPKICQYFDNNPEYAVLGCAQVDPLSKSKSWQYAKGLYDSFGLQFISYFNFFRHYYLLKRLYVYDYDVNNENIIEVAEVPGSFFGINMPCFDDGDVLDDGTFLYWEERLLTKRIWQRGYKVGYISCCIYEHRHIQYSATTNTKSLRLFKYSLESQRYYQQKYLSLNKMQKCLILVAEKITLIEQWLLRRVKPY